MAEKSRKQLVDRCLQVQQILADRRQIKVAELAEKLGVTYDTAYRWADVFSLHMDLRIENGIVYTGRG